MRILGIDEAGRGPVIGPMVIAGVMADNSVDNLGFKDSKLLTRKRREELYRFIIEKFQHDIRIISPMEIDNALNSPELNLNKLEMMYAAKIINKMKPDKVYIDCPSNNISSFLSQLKLLLSHNCEIIAEHKADMKYPIVSAASIIAKVTRDWEIDKIKREYNVDFGSGYPSDEITRNFLKNNYNKYPFFRKSWQSYKNAKQRNLKDF